MIFVETSAKDNTGVEQVNDQPKLLINVIMKFNFLISNLFSKAFLELVDRVLQTPGIWSPGQGLATVGPTQARPPVLGWEGFAEYNFLNQFFLNIFSDLNKREIQARPLVVEHKYMLIGCAHTELHFPWYNETFTLPLAVLSSTLLLLVVGSNLLTAILKPSDLIAFDPTLSIKIWHWPTKL